MVLFKCNVVFQSTPLEPHLHSTMVLFKLNDWTDLVYSNKFTFHYGPIQIKYITKSLTAVTKFTFHYGPIQISIDKVIFCVIIMIYIPLWSYSNFMLLFHLLIKINLHSTMVLFKFRLVRRRRSPTRIYIPLWSYSNYNSQI